MAIKKPKTEQEEWQMLWLDCMNVMENIILNMCPDEVGLHNTDMTTEKDNIRTCTCSCKDCWHDAIWGDDDE